jgi:hypothetical protein
MLRGSLLLLLLALASPAAAQEYFAIRVLDQSTGDPVPCVALRTVHHVALRTDANGMVAFYEPGMMGTRVFFFADGPHVMHAPDGFGFEGAGLDVIEGGMGSIEVTVTGSPGCAATDVESRRLARGVPGASGYVEIEVLDDETGRGVPLVEVRLADDTLGEAGRWVTDSAGRIVIDPLDVPSEATASVFSHGYTFADAEITLTGRAGDRTTLMAHRDNLAERLYRVTGGGIYRSSVLLGRDVPLASPVINGLVLGQDSVFSVVHRGALFWIWGDTNRPAYPLGNFRTSGATSVLPVDGGLDPEEGIDLTYFVGADGFSRAMAPVETVPGEGVTWLGGLVSVPGDDGEDHLFATFGKYLSLSERTRFGMLAYDDDAERFVDGVDFVGSDAHFPDDNGFIVEVGGANWLYYENGIRIPARAEAMLDPARYQAFTPLVGDAVVRVDGFPEYAWRAGEANAVRETSGLLERERLVGHVVDVETGRSIDVHGNGALDPSTFLGRYVRLITPRIALGQTWIAISDTPMGPWVVARRLLSHPNYTFYNPRQHPALARDHGRRIYFDGTYVTTFSGNDDPTPRYDYNQVMYAVDLDDPALALPMPVYENERGELGTLRVIDRGDAPIAAAFLAPEREAEGTLPVWWSGPSCEPRQLRIGGTPATPPVFWALPAEASTASHQSVLYERWPEDDEAPSYGIEDDGPSRAFAVVWRNPIEVPLPVSDTLIGPHPDAGADLCLEDGELTLEPAGAGMQWRIDGEVVEGTITLRRGLSTIELWAEEDGVERVDWRIVRVGSAPPLEMPPLAGCGCRAGTRAPMSPLAWLGALLFAGRRMRRRRQSRQDSVR